jgi:hypothetical protein
MGQCAHRPLTRPPLPDSSPTVHRRHNVLALFQRHAGERMRLGEPPKGLEQAFAQHLQISPSMWSQIKGSRPIGDKLARQIEAACGQEPGWLDRPHASAAPTAAEAQFLALALEAWRATNADGRRRMRRWLKEFAGDSA